MFAGPVGISALWAVHISDGILTGSWLAAGFGAMALLLVWGAWRIHEDEIPQIALLTAAFFVASAIHVKVGPTSAHLLLNGLVGVMLGRRAALAIPVGLAMQALLFMHGGLSALGVNSVIMTVPALLAWQLFAVLHRLPFRRWHAFRGCLVAASTFLWLLSLVYSLVLILNGDLALVAGSFQVLVLVGCGLLAGLAAWIERRLENAPEFPLGLLVGTLTVLITIGLNAALLLANGEALHNGGDLVTAAQRMGLPVATTASAGNPWRMLVLLLFLAHLPIAMIEGLVLGFTVGFLARVRPVLLGGIQPVPAARAEHAPPCPARSTLETADLSGDRSA